MKGVNILRLRKLLSIIVLLFLLSGCLYNRSEQVDNKIDNEKNEVVSVPSVAKSIEEYLLVPSIQKIIKRGYIKVVMVPDDIAVFCRTTKNGELEGLDVDLARKIVRTLGVKLEIHPTKQYSDILDLLSNNSVGFGYRDV